MKSRARTCGKAECNSTSPVGENEYVYVPEEVTKSGSLLPSVKNSLVGGQRCYL